MLDRSFIGHKLTERLVDVEAGQLRFFATATGETDPVYSNIEAAKAAGHPALPAPPTFLFSLGMLSSGKIEALDVLGVDVGTILHGEQHFEHSAQIYAGDRLKLSTTILDIYDKKGGALEFFVQETVAENQHGNRVGASRIVIVVRNS